MTKAEKWARRLDRCIRDMPDDVEIAVIDGVITLLPLGAVERSFYKREALTGRGDVDAYADEFIEEIRHPRIITCGESL